MDKKKILTKSEEIANAKAKAKIQQIELADFKDARKLADEKAKIRKLEKQEVARYEATTPLKNKDFGAKGLNLSKEIYNKVVDKKRLPFNEVASTGTISLALFYFWFQSIKENGKVSFVFIDEY